MSLMKLNWLLVLAMASLSVIECSGKQPQTQSEERVFAYSGLAPQSGFVIDVTRQRVIIGDIALSASFCDGTSDYYCVTSTVFSFAVPKHIKDGLWSWEHDGCKYSVVIGLHETKVFDNQVDTMVIRMTRPSGEGKSESLTQYFLYSPQQGLMAIESKALNDVELHVLISASKVGFGVEDDK